MDQVISPKTQFDILRDRMLTGSPAAPTRSQIELPGGDTVPDSLVVRCGLLDRLAEALGSLAPDERAAVETQFLGKRSGPGNGEDPTEPRYPRAHERRRPRPARRRDAPPAALRWSARARPRREHRSDDCSRQHGRSGRGLVSRIARHKFSSRSRSLALVSPRPGRRALPILRRLRHRLPLVRSSRHDRSHTECCRNSHDRVRRRAPSPVLESEDRPLRAPGRARKRWPGRRLQGASARRRRADRGCENPAGRGAGGGRRRRQVPPGNAPDDRARPSRAGLDPRFGDRGRPPLSGDAAHRWRKFDQPPQGRGPPRPANRSALDGRHRPGRPVPA